MFLEKASSIKCSFSTLSAVFAAFYFYSLQGFKGFSLGLIKKEYMEYFI
jgi:hypothetical protein